MTETLAREIQLSGSQYETEEPWHANLEDAYFEEGEYQMTPEEEDATYFKYSNTQDEICDNAMISNLKEAMWLIHKELKKRKELPSWEKIDFFKEWLTSILEIDGTECNNKPTEPTIAYLMETNAYLTRKLSKLESKPAPSMQPQTCSPETQATPMATHSCLLWASVAAKLAKLPHPLTPRTTKESQPQPAPQEPMADPHCLIIIIQVQPPIPTRERPNGIEVRKKINKMLDKKEVPQLV